MHYCEFVQILNNLNNKMTVHSFYDLITYFNGTISLQSEACIMFIRLYSYKHTLYIKISYYFNI